MSIEDIIDTFAAILVMQIPVVVLAGIGLWFIAARRTQLGRAGRLAKWGFSLLIVHAFASAAFRVAFLAVRAELVGQSASDISTTLLWFNLLNLLMYPLFIVGLALLARAVFVGRNTDPAPWNNTQAMSDEAWQASETQLPAPLHADQGELRS